MRNFKLLLTFIVLVILTTSCTDNTENLITNTDTTINANIDADDLFDPGDAENADTGGSENEGNDDGGKGN